MGRSAVPIEGASPRRSFPALGSAFPLATDEAEAAVDEQERRWPVLCSVIFVLASSILLWALIIAGISWLIPVLASVVALPAVVLIILLCLAFMGKSIR